MGCFSSRSTVKPTERVEQASQNGNTRPRPISNNNNDQSPSQALAGGGGSSNLKRRMNDSGIDSTTATTTQKSARGNALLMGNNNNDTSNDGGKVGKLEHQLSSSTNGAPEDDIMSILMSNQDNYGDVGQRLKRPNDKGDNHNVSLATRDSMNGRLQVEHKIDMANSNNTEPSGGGGRKFEVNGSVLDQFMGETNDDNIKHNSEMEEGNLNDENNMELLRQYVAIDYEITQLEDKDALRVYHEKIEQLEQLEGELDMIGSEAEEVAVRSEETEQSSLGQTESARMNNMSKQVDCENNSVASGATGFMSQRSWPAPLYNNNGTTTPTNNNGPNNIVVAPGTANSKANSSIGKSGGGGTRTGTSRSNRRFNNNLSYSTVEEVFNRKIILEKERDKLKKEVEIVIVECDKLQQRYKKRDEILDKLFDGHTGNGLENHLEQQLNWLLEQKHYVDQVFYAWKRSETLTSRTCEQFASALDLLKRLPKVEDPKQRAEISESIGSLLVKSRQDMEQAQKYNPNVDAPFFTDNETERFDKIIETVSLQAISASEYSQILTIIQFAYRRAVSIRRWLEQILQTTIARDSFELAEEYKWIAIQLRKERINLIKSKLQDPPYQVMVQAVHEQMARQQTLAESRKQHEINRDSGVESETNEIDIEEEIYRLLELNKSRLEAGGAPSSQATHTITRPSGGTVTTTVDELKVASPADKQAGGNLSSSQSSQAEQNSAPNRDELMRYRIERRVAGEQPLHISQTMAVGGGSAAAGVPPGGGQTKHWMEQGQESARTQGAALTNRNSAASTFSAGSSAATKLNYLTESAGGGGSATPTRLRIELDEEARQNLLEQVDQIHSRHKSRMERLRGKHRVKATSSAVNGTQPAEQEQQRQQQEQVRQQTRPPTPQSEQQQVAGNKQDSSSVPMEASGSS